MNEICLLPAKARARVNTVNIYKRQKTNILPLNFGFLITIGRIGNKKK